MPTRLVLDEFDVDLSSLAPRLVVIVIVVIASSADTRTLDAAVGVAIAVAGRKRVVLRSRRLLWIGVSNIGHDVGFGIHGWSYRGVEESQRGILLMDLLLEVRNRQMLLFEEGVVKVTGEALGFADRENRLGEHRRTVPTQDVHFCRKRQAGKGKGKTGKRQGKREGEKGRRI